MMKKLLLAVFISVFALPVNAADLKIGVINMQKLLTQAPQVEAINQKLKKRFSEPKNELEKMAKTIQDLEKKINRDELMMTESKIKKSREDLMKKIQRYRNIEAQLSQELKTVQQQELSVFKNTIGEVLQEIVADEKYDIILNDGVMYAKPALDITDKILQRLKNKK